MAPNALREKEKVGAGGDRAQIPPKKPLPKRLATLYRPLFAPAVGRPPRGNSEKGKSNYTALPPLSASSAPLFHHPEKVFASRSSHPAESASLLLLPQRPTQPLISIREGCGGVAGTDWKRGQVGESGVGPAGGGGCLGGRQSEKDFPPPGQPAFA